MSTVPLFAQELNCALLNTYVIHRVLIQALQSIAPVVLSSKFFSGAMFGLTHVQHLNSFSDSYHSDTFLKCLSVLQEVLSVQLNRLKYQMGTKMTLGRVVESVCIKCFNCSMI